MKPSLRKAWPWLMVFGSASILIGMVASGGLMRAEVEAFGSLPVTHNGRIKPSDSVARELLLKLHGKQQLQLENGKQLSASAWAMELIQHPTQAHQRPLFRIDSPDVLSMLGTPTESGRYLSFNTLRPQLARIENQARLSHPDARHRDPFQNAMVSLNRAVTAYQQIPVLWDPDPPALSASMQRAVTLEFQFNRFQPFLLSLQLYLLAFLALLLAWTLGSRATLSAANWLVLVTFALHTLSLAIRVWLTGRPPVTNLYASAVFVGWGSVGLGLLLERRLANGIGSMVATTTGVLSLIVAQHLLTIGDPMAQVQAVLDSNFWLATHVITITLGYASNLVAGCMGVVFLLLALGTRRLQPMLAQELERTVFAVLCFALWFSFTGTVLGGVWADHSWGRFWGWDPKENGALLLVLWNAVILHARRAGQMGQVGMMQAAIFGNMVTAWSWFGTNLLATGLHSYGFMDSALNGLLLFWAVHLALLALGWIPRTRWRSGLPARGLQGAAPAPSPSDPF